MECSKTILYARFSSVGQKTGTSLQRQLEQGTAYCQRQGWTIDNQLTDEGRSAFHGHHRSKGNLGSFEQDALAGLERGTRLVCENLDRLSRETPKNSFAFINSLFDAGVTIVSYHDGRTYDANTDTFELMMMLAMFHRGNEESVTKSKRSRDNWAIKHQRAVNEGKALSKRCKPWLRVIDGAYVLDEERTRVLNRIFMQADAGEGSQKLTQMLNREEQPWNGKVWHRGYIVGLLRDRSVIGEHVIDGEVVKLYPAAVPADVFERVCTNAEARKEAMGGRKSTKVNNLFSGLCKCSTCGGRMEYVGDGQLRCRSNLMHAGCTNEVRVNYRKFEKAVLDSCLHLALDDNAFTNRAEVARLNTTIAERQNDLAAAQDKAQSLMELFVTQKSQLAQKMALEAEQRALAIAENLEALKAQREAAKGRASNLEHMQRVTDMRARLGTDVLLRKRVAQGFQSLIKELRFAPDGRVAVDFVAQAALLNFDADGMLVSAYDLVKDGRETVPQLAQYAKRRAQAKKAGTLFERKAG